MADYRICLFSIIPGVGDKHKHLTDQYLQSTCDIANLAEQHQFTGALIHYNYHVINPWLIASTIVQHTRRFVPLIALQPAAMPPFTAAKMVEGLASLYNRKIYLNPIVGARKEELEEVGDTLDHDSRYERLREYVEIMRTLLTSREPIQYSGKYYQLARAHLAPGIAPEMMPRFFVSGTSPTSWQVAGQVGDVAIAPPEPVEKFNETLAKHFQDTRIGLGILAGIIARPSAAQAWEVARNRFPKTRAGFAKTLLKQNSESQWIRQMAHLALESDTLDEVFWMGAYHSGQSYCPYFVGSYTQVAAYLERYLTVGVRDIILDGMYTRDEFDHVDRVVRQLGVQVAH